MSTRLLLAVLMGLMGVSTAVAHRLDEYLQATTIALEPDHLTLQLRLIPGVAVAPKVLAFVDTNGDGILTDAEKRSYAARVGHDLSMTLNGQPVTLHLVASLFPPVKETSQGMGGIELTFEGSLPTGLSDYRLTFENHHQRVMTVYLVNCLLPDNPAIHIVSQTRNYNQSVYQLNFAVGRASLHRPSTAQTSNQPSAQPWADTGSVIKAYFVQGIGHILHGYDHLLFISALVLAAASLWELVKIVTVFTLAHSLTLTLAALNLAHLPAPIVEPLVATSILVVALQNVFWPGYAHGRSRLAVVFFFGLFHGLGFASGLMPVMNQLPKSLILWGIVGFSVGVEVGHQLILLPLVGALKALHSSQRDAARPEQLSMNIQSLGSVVIAIAGLYCLWIAFTANS